MNELNIEKLKNEMTPIPGFSPEMYLCHCSSGNVYSFLTNKWMLQESKGSGDDNKYLRTALRDSEGNSLLMYLHEIVMSSYMGIKKSEWRAMGLEVDHINSKNTRDCSISNLRLATSVSNKKNSSYRGWNKVRLSLDTANELREDFNKWTGSKVEWYRLKGKELGVTARSIQNIILGYTYKVSE